MTDLQKANMWKRISAGLFDLIMLGIVVVGMAFLLSAILGYEDVWNELDTHKARIETQFGVDFEVLNSGEEMSKLTEEERAQLDAAMEAANKDPDMLKANALLMNMSLLILTFGLLFGYIIMELIVPLILKNGQTFGKKLFGLAVIREDGIRLSPFLLTVRTVLGKYTVEAMLPVFLLVMLAFGMTGIVGLGVLVLLGLGQIILLATTRARTPIHDLFARTVVVDYASQRIFDTVEEKDAYYRRLHEEMANRADY